MTRRLRLFLFFQTASTSPLSPNSGDAVPTFGQSPRARNHIEQATESMKAVVGGGVSLSGLEGRAAAEFYPRNDGILTISIRDVQ